MNKLKSDFEKQDLGLFLKTERLFLFFGNRHGTRDGIEKKFPDLDFHRIRQTHSDIVIDSSEQIFEADAHYTEKKNTALFISSADCLPVLIFCAQTNRVASVHAGWKGVANQIVAKALNQLAATGSTHKVFQIWIGPHILQKSFEVDLDVLKLLEASAYNLDRKLYCEEKNNKYYVDLDQIVHSQIQHVANPSTAVEFLGIDTKTNNEFWSHRRDKAQAGRNLSFIARIN
jgi:YfiH family protein